MGMMFKKGFVICQDHYKCDHENCKHHEWHKEKGSCKPRECDNTGDHVRCVATARKK